MIAGIPVALALIACGARQEKFEPGERATARSPEGYTAAEYEISGRNGELGEARVWSRGARIMDVDGARRTVVHVGFALENTSDEPIELDLDQLALDSARLDHAVVRDIHAARVDGNATIQPGQMGEINAYFPLPRDVSPQQVDAFRVKWRVGDSEITYNQQTPFVESPDERVYAYYYTPFYDPFFYDPYFYHPTVVVHARPYRHYYVHRR
jgi:hypothetical protein